MGYFLPFYPQQPKKSKLKKIKKTPGDIIILHTCTKNSDQMMYGSWDMVCDRCNHFSFWAIFCPFFPVTARKIKIKNMKKTPRYITILHMSTKNYDQMMYGSWDMACDRCNYFSSWVITPLTAQKIKILKKMPEISSFYICVPKTMIRWCTVPEICCATDGRMDGRTKRVTCRGGCQPKNSLLNELLDTLTKK